MTVLLAIAALVVGLVILMVAADAFVAAAEAIALRLRWSPAIIGAVVVGFGTSLPEMVTSAVAAASGEADLAIGNAAGSNVANLLLILGLAAAVAPLVGTGRGPGRDVSIAVGGGGLLIVLAATGQIGLVSGLLLIAALIGSVAWQIAAARSITMEVTREVAAGRAGLKAVAGLVGVIVGSQALVWGAVVISTELGIPSIVVGSVLVAIGTSLPELATAIASARRGQTELLIGNLIGSNAFNALGVVGLAAVVGSVRGDGLAVGTPAFAVVIAAGFVTAAVGGLLWWRPRISRLGGLGLVAIYLVAAPLLTRVS